MIIYPAIDIKNGNCVRLEKGDFNTEVIFDSNPVSVAKSYEKDGATWLHVIDLDGAQTGNNKNISVIKDIVETTSLQVQVGGGIRSVETIRQLLSIGVKRVILGTMALEQMDQLASLTTQFPNQIIVSVDSLFGTVTYHGWQTKSSIETLDFCLQLYQMGIRTVVYTDISKDGMMSGPNFEDYQMLKSKTKLEVIASGGVSSLSDIMALQEYGVDGAIIGKALYINALSLKEVLSCSQEE